MDRLDAMRLYVRLVELKSLSAAARDQRVRQSTASKWLSTLEDELGAPLVERTTRKSRVTPAGETFYRRAKELLVTYDDISAEISERTSEPGGHLRVSLPVVFGRKFLVPVAADFLRRFRKVELELVFNDRYVNIVEDGFDVAIRVGLPLDTSFRAYSLGGTRRVLVASQAYLDRSRAPRAPADLSDHACLLHSEHSAGEVWLFQKGKTTARAHVRGRFSANNSEALLYMAKAGLGIALLASWLVEDDVASGQLMELLPEYRAPSAPIQALIAPGHRVHPRVRAFLDFTREALNSRFAANGRS